MKKPEVTILIPHYKTLELTKVCLKLIKKHTDLKRVKVLVIDNGSKDESSEYLKTIDWIELMILNPSANLKPAKSHSLALDAGLEKTTTPYVLSIHTDSLIRNKQWLDFLIEQIEKEPNIAGVGSWKLEEKPWYKQALKAIERFWQTHIHKKNKHKIEGQGKNYHYLRSHCALYKTDILKKNKLSFCGKEIVAGKSIHEACEKLGKKMIFLPSSQLVKYMLHINHATMIINPELGARKKTIKKGSKRLKKMLNDLSIPS